MKCRAQAQSTSDPGMFVGSGAKSTRIRNYYGRTILIKKENIISKKKFEEKISKQKISKKRKFIFLTL